MEQHQALRRRLDLELAAALTAKLAIADFLDVVPDVELGFGIAFEVRNSRVAIALQSVNIPFTQRRSGGRAIDMAGVKLECHAMRLSRGDGDRFEPDGCFADGGLLTISLPSIDEECIDAAAIVLAGAFTQILDGAGRT